MAAWYESSDPAERTEALRGEDQHQEGRGEPDVAPDEPEAHRDRHQRDRQAGEQLEHHTREEGGPQPGHDRATALLPELVDGLDLSLVPPEQPQRGQALHHVEEVGGQVADAGPAGLGPGAGGAAHQRQEERDEGQRDREHHGAGGVGHRDADEQQDGNDGTRHQRGEVLGDVGLERVHAAGREHAHAARGPGPAVVEDTAQEVAPSWPDTSTAACGTGPVTPVQQGPEEGGEEEHRRRPPHPCHGGVVLDDAGERGGHRSGLHHQQDGVDDRDPRCRDQERAGGPGPSQQSGIERLHDPAVAGSEAARAPGPATVGRLSVPMRLRKTQ